MIADIGYNHFHHVINISNSSLSSNPLLYNMTKSKTNDADATPKHSGEIVKIEDAGIEAAENDAFL